MGELLQSGLGAEIARLRGGLDRAAAAAETALTADLSSLGDDDPRSPRTEQKELCRQLAALRQRVARAEDESDEPRAVRAELATLMFFARTLQSDAATWRAALDARLQEFERQRAAEREQRARLLAEREELVQRRDALQFSIVETAERMAMEHRGECRRTLPVFTLGESLTVCSVSVASSRQRFRLAKVWLVTLNESLDDVLVKRQ